MSPTERRASASLAALFGLRMLGLFLVLPVFVIEAAHYPGGDDPFWVGVAMGAYGLTQALLQLAYGWASDRLGRKPVIVAGLLVFALGSALAAWAPSVAWLALGRAVQGAGAISAAVTALLADLTRDAVRTKAMALVGASIGAMFALSLVASPLLAARLGLSGLFGLTALLALLGVLATVAWVPAEPRQHRDRAPGRLRDVWADPLLARLNAGVFILHAVQLAMWLAVPGLIVAAGLARADHAWVYLPAVLGSFIVMGGTLFRLERQGRLRGVFLASIALIAVVQAVLAALSAAGVQPGLWALGALLFVFFYGFNVLEASQPSLVSRLAPAHSRGAAMGLYNTLQSLGFFVGGALGGWLVKHTGVASLFAVCALAMGLWLALAWSMRVPGRTERAA